MVLTQRDFKTQLEYDTYSYTKNWTMAMWSDFRNNHCKDYYQRRDYANSLINNKNGDKVIKNQGNQLMLEFNMEKFKNIKEFNIYNNER